jgi:hypothetical protein
MRSRKAQTFNLMAQEQDQHRVAASLSLDKNETNHEELGGAKKSNSAFSRSTRIKTGNAQREQIRNREIPAAQRALVRSRRKTWLRAVATQEQTREEKQRQRNLSARTATWPRPGNRDGGEHNRTRTDQIQRENKRKNEQHTQNLKINFSIKIKQDYMNHWGHRPPYLIWLLEWKFVHGTLTLN